MIGPKQNDLQNIVSFCATCRLCEGSGYQAPPVIGIGNFGAPIIVIAQNPGEIAKTDSPRIFSGNRLLEYTNQKGVSLSQDAVLLWSEWDFGTSHGAQQLARIFGKDWLISGDILYTNAVRCRTRQNKIPSQEMVDKCSTWTRNLIHLPNIKAIVFLGAVARKQILGGDHQKLAFGETKRHPKLGTITAFKHYAAWKDETEVKQYKDAFDNLKLSLKLGK